MKTKRLFQNVVAALWCSIASFASLAALPTAPGSPSYTISYEQNSIVSGTAAIWRETLSDGNEYLLMRITPPQNKDTYTCVMYTYGSVVVDGFVDDNMDLFLDLPLGASTKASKSCQYFAEPKTFILAHNPESTNTSGWAQSKLQTIRIGSGSAQRTILIPAKGTLGNSLATAYNFSDAWYVPAESGWGILMAHHADTCGQLVATFYMYDAVGNSKWFLLSGGTWNGSMFTGDIYDATGFPGGWATLSTFKSANTKLAKVGVGTFDFKSRGTALLSYNIGGVTGSKAIERLAF